MYASLLNKGSLEFKWWGRGEPRLPLATQLSFFPFFNMFSSSSPSTGKLDPHVEMNGTSSDTLALHKVAMENYEKFNGLPKGCCTFEQVVASSAGVLGWAQFTGPAIKFEVPPISNSVPLKEIQHRRKAKKEMKAKRKSLTTEQGQDEFGIHLFATAASKAPQDNSLTISENVQCEHKDFEDKCSLPLRGHEQIQRCCPTYQTVVTRNHNWEGE